MPPLQRYRSTPVVGLLAVRAFDIFTVQDLLHSIQRGDASKSVQAVLGASQPHRDLFPRPGAPITQEPADQDRLHPHGASNKTSALPSHAHSPHHPEHPSHPHAHGHGAPAHSNVHHPQPHIDPEHGGQHAHPGHERGSHGAAHTHPEHGHTAPHAGGLPEHGPHAPHTAPHGGQHTHSSNLHQHEHGMFHHHLHGTPIPLMDHPDAPDNEHVHAGEHPATSSGASSTSIETHVEIPEDLWAGYGRYLWSADAPFGQMRPADNESWASVGTRAAQPYVDRWLVVSPGTKYQRHHFVMGAHVLRRTFSLDSKLSDNYTEVATAPVAVLILQGFVMGHGGKLGLPPPNFCQFGRDGPAKAVVYVDRRHPELTGTSVIVCDVPPEAIAGAEEGPGGARFVSWRALHHFPNDPRDRYHPFMSFRAALPPDVRKERYRAALCLQGSLNRDALKFAPEWVEYHLLAVPVDHVFLYITGNIHKEDVDGPLGPFVRSGQVTVVRLTHSRFFTKEYGWTGINMVTADCMARSKEFSEHFLPLSIDEFLYPDGQSVDQTVFAAPAMNDPGCQRSCVRFSNVPFGGRVRKGDEATEPELVIETFQLRNQSFDNYEPHPDFKRRKAMYRQSAHWLPNIHGWGLGCCYLDETSGVRVNHYVNSVGERRWWVGRNQPMAFDVPDHGMNRFIPVIRQRLRSRSSSRAEGAKT
eukprot:NODE_15_length_2825_cov_166.133646_g12_i0.p1 GENE.NODE_15_length_2825_cov_166.133646_g12_i0~~NODE_15_length_2825_cov_166.133646_g12_i0.p1  ORF type:complete len:697 (-),score=144.44 NODE_15_length_2825_cov_166.133646_g12_i0:248-2338(-)